MVMGDWGGGVVTDGFKVDSKLDEMCEKWRSRSLHVGSLSLLFDSPPEQQGCQRDQEIKDHCTE